MEVRHEVVDAGIGERCEGGCDDLSDGPGGRAPLAVYPEGAVAVFGIVSGTLHGVVFQVPAGEEYEGILNLGHDHLFLVEELHQVLGLELWTSVEYCMAGRGVEVPEVCHCLIPDDKVHSVRCESWRVRAGLAVGGWLVASGPVHTRWWWDRGSLLLSFLPGGTGGAHLRGVTFGACGCWYVVKG